jgi:membrane-bound lytic murein transglycosylase B
MASSAHAFMPSLMLTHVVPPNLPPARSQRHLRAARRGWLATACCMLMTACANQAPDTPPTQVPTDTQAATPASPPRPPEINAPHEAPRAQLTLISDAPPDSYGKRTDAQDLAQELAHSLQLDPQWVWEAIASARYKESATKLVMPAPVGTLKNWHVYRSRFVEPIRIKAGVQFWRRYESELQRAEGQYGVPAKVIAGILGVETIYGRQTGQYRVLDVLTTLSLDFPKGRSDRSAFFKSELGQFLKLCQEQHWTPDSVLGSFAGAVGWPQFMPSSIRLYGVDFDGDGKIDLQNNPVDAIGSVANYLSAHGWQKDTPPYYDVTPPDNTDNLTKLLAPDIWPSFSFSDMQSLGARLPQSASKHTGQLALVQLQNGTKAPTLIAGTGNFYTITRYNQSSYYALAVIQLGDAVSSELSRQKPQP